MAAPTPTARASSVSSTTNATTFSPTLPSGTGGRLFVRVASRSNGALTAGSDWNLVDQWFNGSTLSVAIFWSDTATSLTVTSAVSTQYSAIASRMPDRTGVYVSQVAATGTSTNSNPPAVDLLFTSDMLFEAIAAGQGATVATVAPSGYSNLQSQAGGGANGASLNTAEKSTTAQRTDDPGTFTSASRTWLALTLGFYAYAADPLANTKAALSSPPSRNVRILYAGDSETSGAFNDGSTNTMGSNAYATSRPVLAAAGLTARRGRAVMFGTGGAASTNTAINAYNNTFTAGASYTDSSSVGATTLGKGAWTLGTSGQKISIVPGYAFDRIKVYYVAGPAVPQYTIDVNGGTATTLTGMTGTNVINSTTVSLSGNSSATININGTGSGGYILAVEPFTNGVYEATIFNAGWYGCTSTNMADFSAVYSPIQCIAFIAPDLMVLEVGSNDTGNGISLATAKNNLRIMILTAKAANSSTGEVLYSRIPYVQGVSEASQDAGWAPVKALCSELGVGYFDITTQTGWTSISTANSNGYTGSNDNHPYPAGYVAWNSVERPQYDPGPAIVAPGLFTNTNTFYSPAVTQVQTLSPALFTNTNSFYSPTVTPGAVTLSPALYTNANTFYAPTVTPGAVTLSPALFTNSNAFYSPVVSQGGIILAPDLFTNTNTFYSPTVTQASGGQTLSPSLFVNQNTFYSPTASPGAVTLSPALYTNANVFYSPTVLQAGPQTLVPSLYVNQSVLYSPYVYAANDVETPPERTVYVSAEVRLASVLPQSRTVVSQEPNRRVLAG